MPDNIPNLGHWENDREALRSAQIDGAGLYAAIPELRFRTNAIRLVIDELYANPGPGSPSFFVLGDKDVFAKVKSNCDSVPMLRSQSRGRSLFGSLWFVNQALGHGFARDISGMSASQVMDEIIRLGAGNRPTLVTDPKSPDIAYLYPDGFGHAESNEVVELSDALVDLGHILEGLDGLYKLIRSPDQSRALKLWRDAKKCWPIEKAEEAVQHEVTRALAGRYPRLDVRSEQPSSIGRTDVELIQTWSLPPGQNVRHALIELKVLRSYTHTGNDVKPALVRRRVIIKGLIQAAQYGKENNSRIRMLCCYDMRKSDLGDEECFKGLIRPATDRKVALKRYFLYNSSDDLREARDAAEVADGATPLQER